MGTWGNNLSVLPFYESPSEQDFRLWYAYGENYRLLADGSSAMPFFFRLPYSSRLYSALLNGTATITLEILKVCVCAEIPQVDPSKKGDFNMDFDESFYRADAGGFDFYNIFLQNGFGWYATGNTLNDWIVFKYPAEMVADLGLEEGLYYIKASITTPVPTPLPPEPPIPNTYVRYSEIFTVGNTTNMVKVEWGWQERLAMGNFLCPSIGNDSFVNRVYLDTEIGMPEYENTEEGEERNGYFFPIKQMSQKIHHMKFIAPEYLCDAMRTIFMGDNIVVTDRLGRTYKCDTFRTDVEWLEQGHYASVEASFTTDLVVKKIGKSY